MVPFLAFVAAVSWGEEERAAAARGREGSSGCAWKRKVGRYPADRIEAPRRNEPSRRPVIHGLDDLCLLGLDTHNAKK